MGLFDQIQQSAKKKAFEICIGKYDKDSQKGLNSQELAGFLTEMCSLLGVPLKCSQWQAKIAMKAIDKDSNGVADMDELYHIFLKAQSIITGEDAKQLEKPKFSGPDWHEDGKLGYGKSQGIGMGMPGGSLGYYDY